MTMICLCFKGEKSEVSFLVMCGLLCYYSHILMQEFKGEISIFVFIICDMETCKNFMPPLDASPNRTPTSRNCEKTTVLYVDPD